MKPIPLLSVVALVADVPSHQLTRGQIGTVVERLESEGEQALLVEFSDEEGEAYAMAELVPEQLLVLHRKTHAA